MRAFCDLNKPVQKNMKAGDAASLILSKASVTAVDFTVPAQLKGPKKQVLRFAPNPGTYLYYLYSPLLTLHILIFQEMMQ